MHNDKRFRYSGKQIDVVWDERLCIHIAECGKAEGELFVGGRQPWCDPDLTSPEQVKEVVARCPSGALIYESKVDSTQEQATPVNSVMVSFHGPYFLRGNLKIDDIPADMPGVAFRAALCRCGQSKNKPFCDNSHEAAGFKDHGSIGRTGQATGETAGPLCITPLKDGPLLLKGNVTLVSGAGRSAWQGNNLALCRCGASKEKPFCDGSHQKVGFKST